MPGEVPSASRSARGAATGVFAVSRPFQVGLLWGLILGHFFLGTLGPWPLGLHGNRRSASETLCSKAMCCPLGTEAF